MPDEQLAQPTQQAHPDTERLDWMIQIDWVIEMDHRGWYLRELNDTVAHAVIIGTFHSTPREAIDAGMVITKELDRKDREAIDALKTSRDATQDTGPSESEEK